MTGGLLPAAVAEALRRAFATGLCVEWKPHGVPATLRMTAEGVDGVVYWDCRAFFRGLSPVGSALGRPAPVATEGALVKLVEALERDAASLRERTSRPGEDAAALRALAVRMDAAAILGRMTIAEVEGRW